MNHNTGDCGALCRMLARSSIRALLLGPSAAVIGGLFGGVCGALLCSVDGLPWAYAVEWCLRGAFAGLVAGAIMGAISGIYHVEEAAPEPAAARPRRETGENAAFPPSRRIVAQQRSGVPSRN